MGLDDAIEALVDREVAKRVDQYNDHILHALRRGEDGGDPNFRKHDLCEWFRLYVMRGK